VNKCRRLKRKFQNDFRVDNPRDWLASRILNFTLNHLATWGYSMLISGVLIVGKAQVENEKVARGGKE
jgi:hypothetical protein